MTLLRDTIEARVEKAFLSNLATGTTVAFLINPAQLSEAYEALYARHASPGLSHRRLHYVGNPNATITMSAVYDQLILLERAGPGPVPRIDARGYRRFLQSLLYPRRSESLNNASPPPVLFVWPGLISMRVRVIRLNFDHVMFQSGRPLPRIYTVEIELEEEPLERIFSSDVERSGTIRPWAASAGPRRRR